MIKYLFSSSPYRKGKTANLISYLLPLLLTLTFLLSIQGLFAQTYVSNFSGGTWTHSNTWDFPPSGYPPVPSGGNIGSIIISGDTVLYTTEEDRSYETIYSDGYVYIENADMISSTVSFDDGNLTIRGVLYIEGDLEIGGGSSFTNITIEDGGTLIVYNLHQLQKSTIAVEGNGNLIVLNNYTLDQQGNLDVNSGSSGDIVVMGNMIAENPEVQNSIETAIYVDSSSGSGLGSGDTRPTDEIELNENLYKLIEIINSKGLDGGIFNELLPVELIFFSGNRNSESVSLNWATASEENNSHFEIERSADGKTFEKVGEVEGSGNSQTRIDYKFEDNFNSFNTIYYRLKQVDFNNKFEYSPTVIIRNSEMTNVDISLGSSNLLADNTSVFLQIYAPEPVQIAIMGIQVNGAIIYNDINYINTGSTLLPVSLEGATTGMIILQVTVEGIQKTFKVIKE
ncbi:hypothetical protein V6R21_12820 [Limibacter armeniacum]|uniref:hypothetical protein n=1 Tax=Limibacter armeniacum TaxID=466084 RepID=UPI002FE65EA8